MDKTDSILSALGRLNPALEEHWTREGLPAVKAVEELAGLTNLTRADIEAAASGFTREVARAAAPNGTALEQSGDEPPAQAEPVDVSLGGEPRRQPSPEEVAAALNSIDPAILREALKKVPAEALSEPVPPPPPPMEAVSLSEANAQASALDAFRQDKEREVKRLVKQAMQGKEA